MPYRRWHALLADERYSPSSGMIRDYLELAEGLESPTPYHIWSFLSLVGALAGSRIYAEHGTLGRRKLNLGIVLIGFPAIRKSSAINLMRTFSHGLPLQYGPDDTGGARQGIMSAMLPRWQYDYMESKEEFDISDITLEALSNLDTSSVLAELPSPRIPPASELYFASNELGRLLASPSRELSDFFNDALDGNPLHYQLKSQSVRIPHPLVNLLGATTPGSLSQLLPKGTTEHGFLSRLIFVYADKLAASNPIPQRWTTQQEAKKELILTRLEETFERVEGVLTLTENALRTYTDVYSYRPQINDVRFNAYIGRRASEHVLKVAGILCLARGAAQQQIVASDIRLAHALLVMTEGLMPRSFYGLDIREIAKLQLGIFEYLESQPGNRVHQDKLYSQLTHMGDRQKILTAFTVLADEKKIVMHPDSTFELSMATAEATWNRPRSQFKGAIGFDEYQPMVGG